MIRDGQFAGSNYVGPYGGSEGGRGVLVHGGKTGPAFFRNSMAHKVGLVIIMLIPDTPRMTVCHICRSVGVVWGVNVGIYIYIYPRHSMGLP